MKNFIANIKFTKVTAVFCVLTVIVSMIAFFSMSPFSMKAELDEAKKDLKQAKEELPRIEEEIEEVQEEYKSFDKEYQAEMTKLRKAVADANDELDELCDNYYYSTSRYSDCYYADYKCKSYHQAVEDAEDARDLYEDQNEDKLNKLKSSYEDLARRYDSAEKTIENLTKTVGDLNGIYGKAQFKFICALILCASFITFAVYTYNDCENDRLALVAGGLGIVGSILMRFANRAIFLFNPYFFTAVAFALFIVILMRKDDKNIKVYRVCAVISAVIAVVAAIPYLFTVYAFALGAATVILLAFVLVPVDFKEYISIARHLFYTVITFGIWVLVWIYHVTKNLNKVNSLEKRIPAWEFVLCLLLPLYFAYWLYKNAEYVEAYGDENGTPVNKISILCFIIGFVCPLLSTVLMQDKINQIVGRPEAAAEPEIKAEL